MFLSLSHSFDYIGWGSEPMTYVAQVATSPEILLFIGMTSSTVRTYAHPSVHANVTSITLVYATPQILFLGTKPSVIFKNALFEMDAYF